MVGAAEELPDAGVRGHGIGQQPTFGECGDQMMKIREAQEEIDFGHLFLQFFLITLHETADRHDRLDPAGPLELCRFEDRVDRFALRRVDESAGVDEDDVGVGKVVGERGAVAHQVAHQPLGVDGGLVAAEGDDAEFHPR